MRKRLRMALCAALISAACASTPEATPERDADAKRFEPVTRDAVIYVYRPDVWVTSAVTTLYANGSVVGSSLPGTYFRIIVLPGRTVLESFPAHGEGIEVETRGNDVTFVELRNYGPEDGVPSMVFRRVPPEIAKAAILRCCALLETWRPGQPRLLF